MAGCGQVGDRGQTYAAKNFYDPVKNRTLLWTNADVHPNTTMTLLREMTYNLELQQLEFPPIEEQTQLREEVLASEKNVALPAGGGAVVLLGGKAGVGNQSESSRSSEVLVTFELPEPTAAATTFGVVTMGGGQGTSATEGGFFFVKHHPVGASGGTANTNARSVLVGYHSGGTGGSGGALAPLALRRVMPGVNLRGDDLKVVSGFSGDWGDCQKLCDGTAECTAFTFCVECPVTKCCLKNAIPVPAMATNASMRMVSGIKSVGLLDECPMSGNHSACNPTETLRLAQDETTVTLRVFQDQTFAKCYWQGGRVVMTASTPPSAVASVAVASVGGEAPVVAKAVEAWRVGDIWTTAADVIATPRIKSKDVASCAMMMLSSLPLLLLPAPASAAASSAGSAATNCDCLPTATESPRS